MDDIFTLLAVADALRAARTAAAVKTALAPLEAVEKRLPDAVPWLFTTERDPLSPREQLAKPLRDARRINRDKDASRAARTADALVWIADQLTSDSLPAVLYAARLGMGLSSPATVAGVWRRHEYGFREPETVPDPFLGWRIPQVGSSIDGGWHVRGSLTGIDLAMGDSLMRRLPGGPPPSPTRLLDPSIQILLRTVASFFADPPAADPAVWPVTPQDPPTMPLDARRRRMLDWIAATQPELAGAQRAWRDTADLAASGGWSLVAPDGSCFCREPASVSADALLGRPLYGTAIVLSPDLNLRIGTLAKEIGLPRVLVPPLLAAAYQDLLDGVHLAHADDWMSIAAFVNALTRERLEEYVFSLIATRELTPVERRP
jgi:hypothetical protein